ncbi:hypothetical protein HJC23_008025 [Cyclotella cryptica]|uniref:Peptidase S1 domain-containing protein n=1 Tax=Cyclotella cryptica TaxID=29204 RepID=A0ABD3Q3P3_9STRA|eukprot:CCRYP_009138-RA/>CCRYP_009138-RA protein AED:0.03 eAED:0.03 QI:324/1/1/1/0.5/0.66/3/1745/401
MLSKVSIVRIGIVLILGIVAVNSLDAPPHTIVGGDEIKPNSRPYLVSVGSGESAFWGQICAGTLVSPQAVMTAAHCIFGIGATGLQWSPPEWVEFNRYDLFNDTDVVRVYLKDRSQCDGDVAYHPEFDYFTLEHDVAILFLTTAIKQITPVTLNTDPNVPVANAPLDVSGWGLTEYGFPSVPYAATIKYVTNEACTKKPYRFEDSLILDSMMCAVAEGKDSCYGDSGGPLMLGKGGRKGGPQNPAVQVGIVSWGNGKCADDRFPGVYTRVSAVADYVKDTVCARTGDLCRNSKSGKSKSGKGSIRRVKSKSSAKGKKKPDTIKNCEKLPTFSPTISIAPSASAAPTTTTFLHSIPSQLTCQQHLGPHGCQQQRQWANQANQRGMVHEANCCDSTGLFNDEK